MITGCTIKKHTQLKIFISFYILKNTASTYDNFLYNPLQIYISFNKRSEEVFRKNLPTPHPVRAL
jgi:hypothetical protein